MNPKDTQWSVFDDGIGDPSRDTFIRFIACGSFYDEESNELDCYDDEESNEWLANYKVGWTRIFIVTKTVDFEAKEDYFKDELSIIHEEYGLNWGVHTLKTTINEVEMQDSLINPFK